MSDKINGKFYPLNNQEWERAWQELKPAEIRILYHLRTLDPWGEREMELGVSSLARDLKLDKGTVSRALRSLAEKGWIDLELIKVKVKLKSLSGNNTVVYKQHPCEETTPVAPTQPQLPTDNSSCPETTPVAPTQRSTPETPTPSELENPKTLKTNKTKKTLSEEREREIENWIDRIPEVDREKFLQFARSKAAQLPDPPQLIEKWIASNIDWIKQEFDKAYPQDPLSTGEDKGSAATIADRFFEELHPAVKEGLSSGEISRLDRAYNGLYDSQGNWWKIHDWLDRDESPTTRAAAQEAIAALRQRFSTVRPGG